MKTCKVYDFTAHRESKKKEEESQQQDKSLSLFISAVIPFMDRKDQERLAQHKEESEEFMYIISDIMMKAAEQRYKQG
ncbi:hypothetical protein AF332_11430 [Sporosarcina globispora]|uniref:Uncharacterized protein n=1 Tax=Sporosarcina globispora TaxID=1459 RepID=A0A0M0GBS9_SPOGL|nr:hypothetical protein [Sporosarcina globispora]KON87375.1 hypothetical protein AF332_11430 [Sporosarcina globispora]